MFLAVFLCLLPLAMPAIVRLASLASFTGALASPVYLAPSATVADYGIGAEYDARVLTGEPPILRAPSRNGRFVPVRYSPAREEWEGETSYLARFGVVACAPEYDRRGRALPPRDSKGRFVKRA